MADLSGIQQAVQKIAEQTVQDQSKSAALDKGTASADDIQKLQAALNPSTGPQGAQAVQDAGKVGGVQGAESSSPGSKILDNMRSNGPGGLEELQNTILNGDVGSPADVLKMQMKLNNFTLQTDLLSKVVSKSEQNIETLLKGQ